MNRPIPLVLTALLVLSAPAARAAQSYDNCTNFIDSLPAVLSTQGTWCLRKDLATTIASGSAITVATNNVTIDCNSFKLGGLGAGVATGAAGIFAQSRLNLTVRNCAIRGFERGVNVYGGGSSGHVIVDNRFEANRKVGVFMGGTGNTIRGNLVIDTGGGVGDFTSFALFVGGDAVVIDNTVDGVLPPSAGSQFGAYGIGISGPTNSVVQRNRISGINAGTGEARGIGVYNGTYASVTDNDVILADGGGGAPPVGILCGAENNAIVANNRVYGFSQPLMGCTDDGGNILKP